MTCPVNAWDCPYYNPNNYECGLENPAAECDDFYAYCGEEEE